MKNIAKIILTSVLSLSAVNANAGLVVAAIGGLARNPTMIKFGGGVAIASGLVLLTTSAQSDEWGNRMVAAIYLLLDAKDSNQVVNTGVSVTELGLTPEQAEVTEGKIAAASDNLAEIEQSLTEQGVPADVASAVAPKLTISQIKAAIEAKSNQ